MTIKSEIICVCETHHMKNDVIQLAEYKWYGHNRSEKHINAPKGSGGVGIFVHKKLHECFSVSIIDRSVDGILGISLNCKYHAFKMIVYVCYLSPVMSAWGRDPEGYFAHLTACIYEMNDVDQLVLCGDFNARLGTNHDVIASVDEIQNRITIDHTKSGHCDAFLDFVKDARLCILNGRISPENDNFTCVILSAIGCRFNSAKQFILSVIFTL